MNQEHYGVWKEGLENWEQVLLSSCDTQKLSDALGQPRGICRVRNGHIAQAHELLPQMVLGWAVLVSAALPGSFPPQIVQVTQVPKP